MKLKKISAILLCCSLFLSTQCDEDEVPVEYEPGCDAFNVIVDAAEYQNAESGTFALVGNEYNGDCLLVSFSASGCSGDTWDLRLIDSDEILESFPPQRNLRLVLINNEACLAVFTQFREFDLRALRIEGNNEVILNIEGFSESITYSY